MGWQRSTKVLNVREGKDLPRSILEQGSHRITKKYLGKVNSKIYQEVSKFVALNQQVEEAIQLAEPTTAGE